METLFSRPDQVVNPCGDREPLYVVTVVTNSQRFRNRWKLYEDFAHMVSYSGAILYTVEVAFGDREFVITQPDNQQHLQLRTTDELWVKEKAINLGVQHIPLDWKYVAWIDADIDFVRPDWANETIHLLQHYDVIQMFSKATDLDANSEPLITHDGYMYAYAQGSLNLRRYPYEKYHPGYAWAARRSAFDKLGGLLDIAILGSGDRHMAMALLSNVNRSYPKGISAGYLDALKQWQRRATLLQRNVGYMPGTITHAWHGPKVNRGYNTRWKILVDNAYDPRTDLKPDWQGLWQLEADEPRQIALRDAIRHYFQVRNEDATA